MKHRFRQVICFPALVALALFVCVPVTSVGAQTKPAATKATKTKVAAPPKADPLKARKKIISGIKAYESGNMSSTISILTSALSGGSLAAKDMAKALYYRGLAFRRQKQPAQAIADLNSAVWLKGGLTTKERTEALSNRAAAYKEAGLRDPGGGGGTTAAATKPAAPTPPASPAPPPTVKSPPAQKTVGQTPSAPKPPGTWQTATQPGAAAPTTKTATAPLTTTTVAPSSSGPVSGITNFFSNVFSGGSSPNSKPDADTATPAPVAPPTAGNVSAISAWNSQTTVNAPPVKTPAAAAPIKQPPTSPKKVALAPKPPAPKKEAAPPPAVVASPKGKYAVQVASKRSQAEASQLVGQLARQYGLQLGGRAPRVHEAVIGSMGTFYQVRVGPFAKSSDVVPLCKVLKSGGHDCQLITNN